MTELYTIMRYLQYDTLMRMGMGHFDSWAATFGETVTAIELSPEGTGYRAKTRFARFFNLPELISIFKEAADIQTSDMLNLPVPDIKLPIGISFYTFQIISYVIDCHWEKVSVQKSFPKFLMYVSLFPQLVAGPIERPGNLIPQLREKNKLTSENARIGLQKLSLIHI